MANVYHRNGRVSDGMPRAASCGARTPTVAFVEIREARPEDHQAIAELTVAAYRALPGAPLSGGYEARLRDVVGRATAALVLVAVEDGDIVGAVTYVPGPQSPWAELLDEGEAGVRMLAVHPAAQRRGVGTVLVRACIDRARRDGRRRVRLHTTSWMTDARRIYERLGFRRDPERDWAPVPGVQLLGFVSDLEA
jgi:ribosomal protein S18 acetylase RimI-like enzyme